MKSFKLGIILAFILFGFNSCKKEDMSQYVKKEDAKIENIDLTIQPYQWAWNSVAKRWEYSISHDYIDGALLGYVMKNGKELMPYYDPELGVTYSVVDYTFQNQILITYYDGTTNLTSPSYDTYIYLKIMPSH